MFIKSYCKLVKIEAVNTIQQVEITPTGVDVLTLQKGIISFNLDEADRELAFSRIVNAVLSGRNDDIEITSADEL